MTGYVYTQPTADKENSGEPCKKSEDHLQKVVRFTFSTSSFRYFSDLPKATALWNLQQLHQIRPRDRTRQKMFSASTKQANMMHNVIVQCCAKFKFRLQKEFPSKWSWYWESCREAVKTINVREISHDKIVRIGRYDSLCRRTELSILYLEFWIDLEVELPI